MPTLVKNKRAFFDYEILESFEAGMELRGHEVKSAKLGRINIAGSNVIIRSGEAWLVGADIPPYQPANTPLDYDSKRTRRLLLNRKEISHLAGKLNEKGLTLVPLEVYTKNRLVKVRCGLGRLRKKSDKREVIRKRETEREIRGAK